MLLMIDNFDSFTYNLVHCFQVLHQEVRTVRNDAHTLSECVQWNPSYLVISPGPGHPGQAGLSKEIMQYYANKIPILGVCLGHQCLAEIFGGRVVRADRPMHGMTSPIVHNGEGIFADLPQRFSATRYHSLLVDRHTLPPSLEITAETDEGEIMGLRHREFPFLEGVQFHPESVLSEHGLALLQNFVNQKKGVSDVETIYSFA